MYLSEQKIQNLTDGAVNSIMTALYGSRWSGTNNVTEDKELMDMSDALDGKIYTLIENANRSKFEDDLYAALKKHKRCNEVTRVQTVIDYAMEYEGLKTPEEIVKLFFEELDSAE
jgi:hypothetical protein